MRSRRLRLPSAQDFPVRVYTYHDSCYLERWNGIFEAPRNILRLIGGTVAEMEASHAKNLCCGDEGEGTLKRYLQRGNCVVLQPFNPAYNELVIKGEDLNRLHIAGRVVETKAKW